MNDDIVTRLRNEVCECGYAASFNELHKCLRCEAIDEIERLRKWASYEHAGYCRCAGGNPECVNKSYEVWKSMQ